MLKLKKIIAIALSLVMAFCVFSVAANAANTSVALAEVAFDLDLAGVDADDYHEYVTVLTDGLDFEENYGDPGVFVDDVYGNSFHGVFEDGETYFFYIYLTPETGYEFADIVEGKINGNDIDTYIDGWYPDSDTYGDVYVPYVKLYYVVTVSYDAGDSEGEVIETAEISIDTDLAGYYVEDYEYYINILSENLDFEDNYDDPAVFVYDAYGTEYYGAFESGETYTVMVFLTPEYGYELADEVSGYVNGEEVNTYVGSWYPGVQYGDPEVDFVGLEFDVTVDGEKSFSFFDLIIEFFMDLYVKFLATILIWFI